MSVPVPDSSRRGVIHDLGYQPYHGPRLGSGAVAWALFATGLRHVFGLGRSGKSKLLPWSLLALNLLPALIVVGVMVMIDLDSLPIGFAQYASTTQLLVSIFVAAQAPILFSHDQRHGSIVLYLARPLRSTTYALVRLASLWAAILVYLVVPVLLLYVGALLAELPLGEQTADALKALSLAVLLAGMLAGIAGVISSWTVRRGLAVVATIIVLLLGNGIVTILQGISLEENEHRLGEIAGLFTPYSLYRGLVEILDLHRAAITPPEGTAMTIAYVVVTVATILACAGLLAWRFGKVANR